MKRASPYMVRRLTRMPTRNSTILLLLLLPLRLLAADTENTSDSDRVTPERCSLHSPDALLALWANEDGRSAPLDEAGIDGFYRDYAEQLAKKTDALDPDAKKFRALLLKCFQTSFEYLREVHHHKSTNHLWNRISGELEWIQYRGALNHYQGSAGFGANDAMSGYMDDESDYTDDLIRQIAIAIGKANASSLDHFDSEMLPILDRALTRLAEATKFMDETQACYFRRHLAVFITRFP